MLRQTQIVLWRLGAVLALALGVVGIAVPVLPTVPFVILAAWAAGRGWPALEQRLLAHPTHGLHIRAWRERGVVSRRAKIFATLAMTASTAILQFTVTSPWLRFGAPAVMLIVAIWLWRRPED